MYSGSGHVGAEPNPQVPGLYCVECEQILSHASDLRICNGTQGGTTVTPAPKSNPNVTRRLSEGEDSAHCPKAMHCRNCHACVGKCKPGSIFASGLYDSYTPRKTFFISEDLRRHTFQKWGDKEKAMLENSGGMNVPLNDVLREAGSRWPSREGHAKYKTVHVDMSNGALHPDITKLLTKTTMRNYQVEVMNYALMRNSLVCLPTGSGKTLISIAVIHAMLRINKQKMAVFAVKTNPLVEQQANAIKSEIPELRVNMLSGQIDPAVTKKTKKALIKTEVDVLVCTCQVLVNCLQEFILRVEDVCVLVLDEAHHAHGQDPMAMIVKTVHQVENQVYRPLLLGMTASPLEKPKLEDIDRKLNTFCSQIKCSPCYPIVHDPLRNGYNKTKDFCSAPEANPAEAQFREKLQEYMKKFAGECRALLTPLGGEDLEHAITMVLNGTVFLDTNSFRGNLRKFQKSFRERIALQNDESRIPKELIGMGHALVNHFIETLAIMEINNIVGHSVAKAIMHKVLANLEDPKSGSDVMKKKLLMPNGSRDITKDICEAVQGSHDTDGQYAPHRLSARCKLLIDIILKHIEKSDESGSARILVFVDMRRTAKKLHTCLRKHPDISGILNPQVLVGQGTKGDGLLWAEQREVLQQFDSGATRLVIATTVLEEGIDVATCNLVVRFSAPLTYRQFIQSRGRACRSPNGDFRIICQTREEMDLQYQFSSTEQQMLKILRKFMEESPIVQDENCIKRTPDMDGDFERMDRIISMECTGIDLQDDDDSEEDDSEDDERVQELLDLSGTAEEDLMTARMELLDEFDCDQLIVSAKFVRTAMSSPHTNSRRKVEELFRGIATVMDWYDIKSPIRTKLITQEFPICHFVPSDNSGIKNSEEFEKYCIERATEDSFTGQFWMSIEKPILSEAISLRLEVHKLRIGSLFDHHHFLCLNEGAKTVRLQIDLDRRKITITFNTVNIISWSFDEMHDFVLVTRCTSSTSTGEDNSTASIYFTLKNPPKLLELPQSEGSEPAVGKRVSGFPELGQTQGNIFGYCLTYELELPNPGKQTENQAFAPSIARCFDMMEKMKKTVYYTAMKPVKYPSQPLPGPDDGIDPMLCCHHQDNEVNYAWRCMTGSQGFVRERFRKEFFDLLNKEDAREVPKILYAMATKMERGLFWDPVKLLRLILENRDTLKERLDTHDIAGHAVVKRVAITPTRLLFFQPDLMQTNRIIREFKAENFMRVNVREETMDNMCALFGDLVNLTIRIGEVLRWGIRIADTCYDYLASSNSQLRNHSCWFIEEDGKGEDRKAHTIRRGIGDLSDIRNVASFVSRMGQGFSTSYQTIEADTQVIDEIKKEEYIFSDGIGKMSMGMARKIAEAMHLPYDPSAFQIRLGGSKGVVAMDPTLQNDEELYVRDSMQKYESSYRTVEILELSRPSSLDLNQQNYASMVLQEGMKVCFMVQIIMLLSNSCIGDEVLLNLLRQHVDYLSQMFIHEKEALEQTRTCSPYIDWELFEKAGIRVTTEPYLRSVMMAHYRCSMKDLVEKSKIPIHKEDGRVLLGVLDETRTLQYGQVFIQITQGLLEDLGDKIVIKQRVVISKNPCLHPGDVRVFDAVDVKSLHHMVDVVVFPAVGPRPHPNELSGSDLDGDKYHCIWHPDLVPNIPNKDAMDYPKDPKQTLDRCPNVNDMIDHMCIYIESDTLGQIDNTHLALADQLGLESQECLDLAKMHSKAVDAPKTGNWQQIGKDIRDALKRYPDFMMKTDKPSYPSEKVLGKIYRECSKYVNFCESSPVMGQSSTGLTADPGFKMEGFEDFKEDAMDARFDYNAKLFNMMKMYGIETEAEIMSCRISTLHQKLWSERHDINQTADMFRKSLAIEFRERFLNDKRLEEPGYDPELRKQQKASAWYWASYVEPQCENYTVIKGRYESLVPFRSFPWIVSDYLSQVYMINREQGLLSQRNIFVSIWDGLLAMLRDSQWCMLEKFKQLKDEVSGCLKGDAVIVHGSAATCLLDGTDGDVSLLLLRRKKPESLLNNRHERERLLTRVQNDLRQHCLKCTMIGVDRLKITLRTKLSHRKAQLTADPGEITKWLILKEYIFKNEWLLPYLQILQKWITKTGLVGGRFTCSVPDYYIPYLFINFCFSHCPGAIHSVQRAVEKANEITHQVLEPDCRMTNIYGPVETWESIISKLADGQVVVRVSKLGDLLTTTTHQLLESEMDRAHHRLALHIDAMALVSNLQIEKVFYVETHTANAIVGNEPYFKAYLRNKSGAYTEVHPRTDHRNPGIIVKAAGTCTELHVLEQTIQALNKRFKAESKKKVCVRGSDKAEGCHSLLVEGSLASGESNIDLEQYYGKHHFHHERLASELYVVRHMGETSGEEPGSLETLYHRFQTHLKRQLRALKQYYNPALYGPLQLQIKFGRTYVISPPQNYIEDLQLNVQELLDALDRKKSRGALLDWDDGPKQVAVRRRRRPGQGRQDVSMSFVSHTSLSNLRRGFQKWLENNNFEHLEDQTEKGVKLICNGGAQGNFIVEYDADLKLKHVENPSVSWAISDIKRQANGIQETSESANKDSLDYDGAECDIRFMLKTQMPPSDKERLAVVSGLQLETALERDAKENIQIRHKAVWEISDHYKEFTRNVYRKVSPTGGSEPASFLDRVKFEAIKSRMYTQVKAHLKYGPPKEIWELRVIPPTADLLDRDGVNQLLEDIWKLGFELSGCLSLDKDTISRSAPL